MPKALHAVAFFILFFISLNAHSLTYRLNANYFVRSSANFSAHDNNKVGVLSKGCSFKVVNSKKLSDGAEALEIRIVGLTPASHINPSDSYWIYKPNNIDFTKQDLGANTETEAQISSGYCRDCNTSAQNNTDLNRQNTGHLADISRQITGQQNQPSELTTPRSRGALDAKIKKYSDSTAVKSAIESALKNKSRASRGQCYRSVKKALLAKSRNEKSLIPYHYSDLAALGSKQSLKQFGFVNLLDSEPYKSEIGNSPSLAPKGAVLVYSSGIPCGRGKAQVPDCGHVEIKTGAEGQPGYVSDYYSRDAINQTPAARRYGTRYKLVGVMIKP